MTTLIKVNVVVVGADAGATVCMSNPLQEANEPGNSFELHNGTYARAPRLTSGF